MWQDYVILAGSIVAIASLIPILLDEDAGVPLTTSVPTLVVLSGQAVAFYTLDLTGAAAGAAAGFGLWSLIAIRKTPDSAADAAGGDGAGGDLTDGAAERPDRPEPAVHAAD